MVRLQDQSETAQPIKSQNAPAPSDPSITSEQDINGKAGGTYAWAGEDAAFACIQGTITNSSRKGGSSKLAEDDGNDEKDEDGDDGDGDYPVRSHPVMLLGSCSSLVAAREGGERYSTYEPSPSAS